jgi:hypothetical protein
MANEKHIFIGIGGSGCQTVSQIKQKVYEKRFPEATATKSRLQAMNDSYRFIFLDTDQRDIDEANKRNRATFEQGKVPFINPQTDLINLGRANPHAIYYEAKQDPHTLINKRILEACSPELATKIPDSPLAFGAGAFRMKSRIAFAHSLAEFHSKVQAAISSLNDVKTVGGEDCIIYYWVVGSTLGGTGSGIFNDVLYHLNQIHYQVVGNGDPQLVLTMYMPKVYIDSNATEEKYTLNAFGVFSELEAFKSMSFNAKQNIVMHRLAFQNDYSLINSNKRYCPFYYLIPIDIQTDKGTSLGTTRTMYSNTAEMLYHLHYGKAGSTFRSDIDNYMNDIMERNHKEFLVPMGYVSLQKPNEMFNKYMRFRFKRDILRSWLLSEEGKAAKVDESQIPALLTQLFRELDSTIPDTIAFRLANGDATRNIAMAINNQDPNSETLDEMLKLENLQVYLNQFKSKLESETKLSDKRDEYKRIILDGIWSQAETWVRSNGLSFAHDAIDAVRKRMADEFQAEETQFGSTGKSLNEKLEVVQNAYAEATKITLFKKIRKNNKECIQRYISELSDYITRYKKYYIAQWAHDLKKDFCADEKNDELARLKKHIASFKDKVSEMNYNAVSAYKKLASDMGTASMDVTTVYLPQLTTIADGNGWIADNIFSRLYTTMFSAQHDEAETAERKDLQKFFDDYIYNATNESVVQAIKKGQYQVTTKKEDPKTKKVVSSEETRFFCNPKLERANEKVIDDFLSLATDIFERKMRESKEIQERWNTKKISAFFADLTNEEKDNVRRNLNPALFFSYNSNRIDVIKKEEHVVFVAGNEDLAIEMLGFQKGNPKHRFEVSDNENTALVLKSKYGLSLEDYRIYDSIKMVYDKATFREKYHFHHNFAQYLDKLTVEDLPEEVLPQHRTYAKMLILDMFKDKTAPFFYKDEYDPEVYSDRMFFSDCDTSFMIATAEALSINQASGQIILKTNDNGRSLYKEIEGADFPKQFATYRDLYYNYRFGETTEVILQSILRQNQQIDGKQVTGEQVFKDNYNAMHVALLNDLITRRNNARNIAEKRLYNVLFYIVRKEFDTVHKFIK